MTMTLIGATLSAMSSTMLQNTMKTTKARHAMAPHAPKKAKTGNTLITKILITAVSLAATVGGWALLANDPTATAAASHPPAAIVPSAPPAAQPGIGSAQPRLRRVAPAPLAITRSSR
jgi:hypothetical protein